MNFTQIVQANPDPEEPSKRKPRATALQREQYIQLWRESRMTRKVFCKEHKLHPLTFSNWLNKIKASPEKVKTEAVQLSHPVTGPCCVEFQLPNQIKITIDGCLDSEFILAIMKGATGCKFN